MKTNKSLLIKVLTIVSALCLSMAMVFGLVGCGEEARSIIKSEIINGKLVVTYSDNTTETLGDVVGAQGAQGGTLATGCSHEFATNVYKLATCTQKGTDIQICVKCKGYQLVETDLNPDLHGIYQWVKDEVTGISSFEFVSTKKDLPQDEFEVANGACPKQECTACNKQLKQHNMDWVLADSKVNACENEHLELYACLDCNAVVTDSRVSAAKGHKYNVETATYVKEGSVYKVTLTCDECGEPTVITADLVSEQVANCGQGGFKVYSYTYNNFDFMTEVPADKNVTVEFKPEEEITDKTNAHKIGNLAIAKGDKIDYTPSNTEELNALIEAGKIEIVEDAELACNTYETAVFACELCSTEDDDVLVTFSLSGEHDYETIQPADCETDGYYNCKDCGHDEYADELAAKGHDYKYVADSINVSAKTIKVKCSKCDEEITTAINDGVKYTAQDCKDKSKTTYTTTELTNGLAEDDVNYAVITISVTVEEVEQKAHTLTADLKFVRGEEVDYVDAFDALFADGTIEWDEGEPGTCEDHQTAIFRCTVCESLVTIQLSGKHDFEGNEEVPGTVDCVDRVANTTLCNVCGDVITSYTGAKGHTLVANEDDWAEFIADPANNMTVNFACECGFNEDLTAVVATRQENNDCVVTDVTIYTFTYNYTIKDAHNEDVAKVFTTAKEFGVSVGKHTIGLDKDGVAVKVERGEKVEFNEVEDVMANIEWDEGEPGTCDDYNTAIFRCTVCEKLVTIELSGQHDISEAELQTKAADCDNAGYTYKVCAHNEEHIIKIDDIPALEHIVEYKVVGNSAASNDAINPGKAVGECKREGCTAPNVEVEGKVLEGSLVEANCMKAGTVTFTYVDANGTKVCDDVVMTIPKVAEHKLHTDGTPIEVKFDADGDGKLELYYFCEDCKGYVFVEELDD